jgi:hypothetical protein
MNSTKPLLLTILFLAAAGVRAADEPPAKILPLAERIQSLLGPHLRPTPLPVTLPNPFALTRGSVEVVATAAAVTAAPTEPTAKPVDPDNPAVDIETLARCILRLRIGGTIEVGGITQLVVNQAPYREGDLISVNDRGATVQLLLVQLNSSEITFRLRDATQVVRLKTATAPARPEK